MEVKSTVPVKRYLRRRLTKQMRMAGMVKAAQSRKTPPHMRKGLRKYLDRQGVKY
jgi:hypothetical protein